ncbi:MAG TPA: undecaprenyl-diphosphate phosphatase, partial [Patescibacteria group bacterium]|nr:undecaprenyl-diphosphate phosphatase [Patescibacteria group bacterium]
IVPGVSRSGATIIAGLLRGLDRVTAARFSFLLSTPIIFGASLFTIHDLLQEGITGTIVIGTAAAAVSGYIAIASLLRFVERSNYAVFFWYRLAVAGIVVAVFVGRSL